jgi:hypothetical protein
MNISYVTGHEQAISIYVYSVATDNIFTGDEWVRGGYPASVGLSFETPPSWDRQWQSTET